VLLRAGGTRGEQDCHHRGQVPRGAGATIALPQLRRAAQRGRGHREHRDDRPVQGERGAGRGAGEARAVVSGASAARPAAGCQGDIHAHCQGGGQEAPRQTERPPGTHRAG